MSLNNSRTLYLRSELRRRGNRIEIKRVAPDYERLAKSISIYHVTNSESGSSQLKIRPNTCLGGLVEN